MPFVPDKTEVKPSTTPGRFVPGDPDAPRANRGTMALDALKGLGNIALTGVEEGGAKMIAGYSGLGQILMRALGLSDADPADVVRATEAAPFGLGRTQPSEEAGKLVAPIAETLAPVGKAVMSAIPDNPAAQTIVPAVAQAAAEVLPLGAVAKPVARAVSRIGETAGTVAKDFVTQGAKEARRAGYKLRPSSVKAQEPSAEVPGQVRQSINDPRDDVILSNQQVTTKLAGEDLGVPDAKGLDDTAFNGLKAPHFDTYRAAEAAVTRVPVSPELQQAFTSGIERAKFKPGTEPTITQTIGALRRRARKQIDSQDIATQESGYLDLAAADALEEQFGKRLEALGDAEMMTAYRDARQALAKINDVENVTRAGQVDAVKLAEYARKRNIPLTGRLKMIADAAENFPADMKHSQSTAARSQQTEGVLSGVRKAVGAGVARIPGVGVMTDRFQNQFGPEATPVQKTYFGDAGVEPEFSPARQAPVDEGLPFEPTSGVVPSRAVTLSQDLGLEPSPVAGAEVLPEAPGQFVADVAPEVRGDIDFEPSQPLAAETLAGELGLEDVVPAQVPGSIDYVPPTLADLLVGDETLLPDQLNLGDQLAMGGADVVQPPSARLTPPPGRAGKQKKPKAAK